MDDSIFVDVEAARRFVDWLLEPVSAHGGSVVSRYVHAAYEARPDLQRGYPLEEGAHGGLLHWAWVGGRTEMGMQAHLLPEPSPAARAARPSRDPRERSFRQRLRGRALDAIDVVSRGRIQRLTRRRPQRLLELAGQMVLRYRGGPSRVPITLLRTQEHDGDAQLARWHGLKTGGVRELIVQGTHLSMMREPDVADVARRVAECVDRVVDEHAPATLA